MCFFLILCVFHHFDIGMIRFETLSEKKSTRSKFSFGDDGRMDMAAL